MHYLRGTNAARFIFIAVEKEYPFAVGVYELDNEACGLGEELRQRDMQRIKTCKKRNEWPGYSNDISSLSLPPYATNVEFSSYDF
jgi:exodeoxyribonuclease VIII